MNPSNQKSRYDVARAARVFFSNEASINTRLINEARASRGAIMLLLGESMTGKEVVKQLHCSFATMSNLVSKGFLTDRKPHINGHKKHYADFDHKQVEALAQVYTPRMSMKKLKKALAPFGPSKPAPRARTESLPTSVAKTGAVDGVMTRLLRIEVQLQKNEELLKQLVAMWL